MNCMMKNRNPKTQISKRRKLKAENHLRRRHIPEEITQDILSRVPVKSLVRFKLVSKSWSSLISSKAFVKFHLNVVTTKNHINFMEHNCTYCSQRPLLPSLLQLNDPLHRNIKVLGSCNGLCCVTAQGKFLLWNPATRDYYWLPEYNSIVNFHASAFSGFGFDESHDDYKLLLLNPGHTVYTAYLYSLRTDSWKRILDIDGHVTDLSGSFVSGRLHWGVTFGKQRVKKIISFDLATEVYGFIELPGGCNYYSYNQTFEVDGFLCAVCWFVRPSENRTDIWILNQYGLMDSWCLIASVPQPVSQPVCNYQSMQCPLHVLPNGEIVGYHGSNFVIYNTKDNSFRYLPFKCQGLCFIDRVGAIVQSLVSPKPGTNTI